MEGDPEGREERFSDLFEKEDRAVIYTRSQRGLQLQFLPRSFILRVRDGSCHPSLERRSDMKKLAGDGELQRGRRDFIPAPVVINSDEQYCTTAENESALPKCEYTKS